MTYLEALDAVIARTKNERLRVLCDGSHPDHERWRAFVVDLAARPVATPGAEVAVMVTTTGGVSLAESLAIRQALAKCPWRAPDPSCGCAGMARCSIGKGKGGDVSHADCWECCRAEVTSLATTSRRA